MSVKLNRRLLLALIVVVGSIPGSVPILFVAYGVLGAAFSGLLVLFLGILLPLPLMLLLKQLRVLPVISNTPMASGSPERRSDENY